MIHPWYTTREDVKSAADVKFTARTDAQVDRAIEAGARSVEGLLGRRFYPYKGTRYKDWPQCPPSAKPYRLELGWDELISLTTLVVGGVTIPATDYYLLDQYDLGEPPYTAIELDLTAAVTSFHSGTRQRSIAKTGVFGYWLNYEPAGVLSEALDISETGVDISDSSLIGVGDLILVDTEHLLVTGKAMIDTGVDIHASDSLAASANDVSITVSTTTGMPVVGETILIDSERMLVVDVAGSVVTVKRAHDGSTLATHAAAASIYAPRTITVTRGAEGTTAATHLISAAVSRFAPPALISELNAAYALNTLLQRSSGYARVAGQGEGAREMTGRGIDALEADAIRLYLRPGWEPARLTGEEG